MSSNSYRLFGKDRIKRRNGIVSLIALRGMLSRKDYQSLHKLFRFWAVVIGRYTEYKKKEAIMRVDTRYSEIFVDSAGDMEQQECGKESPGSLLRLVM